MRAFQTLRTRNNPAFKLADFEIFTMILSALEWKKYNGEIFLYTDSTGKKILDDAGITEIWDGVHTSLDVMDTFGIDENIFWAGAKIFALAYNPVPCVSIDLDFILWQPMNFDRFGDNLAVIHRESTNLPCYPDADFFHFTEDFSLPLNLNWALEPCNAAFVYFGSKKFVDAYRDFAFDFMHSAAPTENQKGWDLLPYMVFIEQRWLSMCAENCGVKIYALSDLNKLFDATQNFFTHIWGYKRVLRENPADADKFCRDCAGRISNDFPTLAKKFSRLDRFKNFFVK